MRGFFITGTNTGVGKTLAAAGITKALRDRGVECGICKPVQSGVEGDPLEGDLGFLLETAGISVSASLVNLYSYRTPVTPLVASEIEGNPVHPAKIIPFFEKASKEYDMMIVEGVGGLLSPIAKNYSNADMAFDLGLPLLIVAPAGLGTIHQTLATVEAARNRGLEIAGIVFNAADPLGDDPSINSNARLIEELSGVAIVGNVPFLENVSVAKGNHDGLGQAIARSVNLERLETYEQEAPTRLEDDDYRFVWHPFTQMQEYEKESPLVIEKADGVYLYDIRGNRYLDGVSSLWVNVHGHRHPWINQRIRQQLGLLAHSTLLGVTNRPAVELAQRLVEIAPEGLTKVFYSDNGSTAVEVALKMAYQFWKNRGENRKTFLGFENGYHGDTMGALSVGGIDLFHKTFSDLSFKTLRVPYPEKVNYLDNLDFIVKEKHKDIAAVVVEPLVQGAGGMRMMVSGAMKEIRDICDKYKVLLIADEVAVGFGRTGKMFACEHDGVTPDFLCVSKGITGGYLPLAATLTTEEVFRAFRGPYEEFKTFFHGHSYTGNPLGCAAGLASLEVFEKERTLDMLPEKIDQLTRLLDRFRIHKHVKQVRQKGMMVGIEIAKDKSNNVDFGIEERMGHRICLRARQLGAIFRPLGNVLVVMPPLNIAPEALEELMDILFRAMNETLSGHEAPSTPQ